MLWFVSATTFLLILIYFQTARNISNFDNLKPLNNTDAAAGLPMISVIIPAYNESRNIRDCVMSVLNSTHLSSSQVEVIVVDDRSTDNTLELLKAIKKETGSPILKVIEGSQRPKDRKWVGKNWACWQGAEAARGEYLLFIDADVRLKKTCVEAALSAAVRDGADLLSAAPLLKLGFLGEHLIQPVIMNNMIAVMNPKLINNPAKKFMYFALGPFMLFKTATYRNLDGHRGISDQVLDDVIMAQRIKHNDYVLRIYNGRDIADLAMYDSWKGIIEGWSKNYYLGLRKNPFFAAGALFITLLINFLPWLNLALAIFDPVYSALLMGLLGIGILFMIRRSMYCNFGLDMKYWWLSSIGSLLVSYITISSIYKSKTGKNWTWKGRSLEG